MFKRILRSRLTVGVAAFLVGLTIAGTAWAMKSPIDSAGVVHACYNPSTGSVRLNVTGSCPAKGDRTPITWSVTGPPGTAGKDAVAPREVHIPLPLAEAQIG